MAIASAPGGSAGGPGTRPGLRSQTLVSTGQAELDRALGGGLPLGGVLLLLHDALSPHADTLLRLFVAEGLASGQAVHWACDGPAAPEQLAGLPRLLLPSERSQEGEAAEGQDGSGLRIAWQYRRYIQEKQGQPPARQQQQQQQKAGSAFKRRSAATADSSSSGSSSSSGRSRQAGDWCHAFDISRPMQPSAEAAALLERGTYSGADAMPQLLAAAAALKQRIAPAAAAAAPAAAPAAPAPAAAAAPAPVASSGLPGAQNAAARQPRRLLTSMSGRQTPGTGAAPAPAPQAASVGAASEASEGGATAAAPAGAASASEQQQQPASKPTVARLAVRSLGSFHWLPSAGTASAEAAVLRTLRRLKAVACSCRMAVVASVPAGAFSDSGALRLQHLCDAALAVEAAPEDSDLLRLIPDPRSCCGTLRLLKLPAGNTQAPALPQPDLFLIRHRRRRLKLEPFEVDPDAEAAAAEQQGSGQQQVPGLACRGPPAAPSPLDF